MNESIEIPESLTKFATAEDFLACWNRKPAASFSRVCRNIVIGGMVFDSSSYHVYEKFVHAEIVVRCTHDFKAAIPFSLLRKNNWTMEA